MTNSTKVISVAAAVAAVAAGGFIYGVAGLTTVDPGEYAIIIKQFGDDKGVLNEGLSVGTHWIDPFMYDIEIYDTKAAQYPLEVHASTKDGQPVEVSVAFEVSLEHDKVKNLHSLIGRNYYRRVVEPAARAAIRDALPTQLSDKVYTDEGRTFIQGTIEKELDKKQIEARGINVSVNLQEVKFLNQAFVQILEQKASAAQKEEINRREAVAAEQEAIRVANVAEGQKQKLIKEAEANREQQRLEGEGYRLNKEEEAKGILATVTAQAEGVRLNREALSGPGGKELVQIKWAENLGPNVKVYGFPTGAPGTSSIMDLNGVLKGAFAGSK